MKRPGTRAPDFTLPGTAPDGSQQVTEYQLTDALESGPVLINFYVFDFHPACTENLCDLHTLAWFDLDTDVTVFGISTDRSFSHKAFADSEQLFFTLLSDSDGTVAESYDVLYDEFQGHKRIAKRAVFVVDTDQTIQYAWVADDPQTQPDWTAIKEALADLEHATHPT